MEGTEAARAAKQAEASAPTAGGFGPENLIETMTIVFTEDTCIGPDGAPVEFRYVYEIRDGKQLRALAGRIERAGTGEGREKREEAKRQAMLGVVSELIISVSGYRGSEGLDRAATAAYLRGEILPEGIEPNAVARWRDMLARHSDATLGRYFRAWRAKFQDDAAL
jgi:hypothetical protein